MLQTRAVGAVLIRAGSHVRYWLFPADAMRLCGTAAVSCVAETKVVVSGVPVPALSRGMVRVLRQTSCSVSCERKSRSAGRNSCRGNAGQRQRAGDGEGKGSRLR